MALLGRRWTLRMMWELRDGYALTEQGKSLFETLVRLDAWAADWRPRQSS
ncbi:hypothetical protein Amsp01_070770 [Amycolatopsis sp. NBRC 101858]|nr:hypothetical protein [Amycolatopsis sp. NBRC 101858]GLY41054.1 hypothetical protein Amsp01_070770 [Amycolatopsis sp. NBRC 101858]